jgi:predicted dehydrogenase
MGIASDIHLGISGACGRGANFKSACDAIGGIRIHAVCDINKEQLPHSAEQLGANELFYDFDEMLDKAELDAVIIGTPMPLHVSQSIGALQHGLHVLSEVPAGISIDECQTLVATCKDSEALYMMAENYVYMKNNVIIQSMIEQGLFGTVYYAEGEYIHELKKLNETTPWRRKWQTGINGITYGTHSLGPILQWMKNERVTEVCCAGTGHHYHDPRGEIYENEDTCVMLCRMSGGGLVKIRVDMLSGRPHAMTNYQVQGTDGCYESARSPGERDRAWIRSLCSEAESWHNLETFEDTYLPEYWKMYVTTACETGHGGGDLFVLLDFVEAMRGNRPCRLGIHEAMDMTLPGLISQQSIAQGGTWCAVPDSREW